MKTVERLDFHLVVKLESLMVALSAVSLGNHWVVRMASCLVDRTAMNLAGWKESLMVGR